MLLLSIWSGAALSGTVFDALNRALTKLVQCVLVASLLLSFAFRVGWIHRLMVWSFEREATKALNGTPVTVGSIRVDLLRGKMWASNIVLHAPRRQAWKWQSPVQAHVGKLYVECNLVLCLLSLWFLWEERPIDISTVEASDIQGFVERRDNVFNFYLMDPHIDVPDPVLDDPHDRDVEESDEDYSAYQLQYVEDDAPNVSLTDRPPHDSPSAAAGPGIGHAATNVESDSLGTADQQAATAGGATTAAQILVDDMVRALGRATQHGGSFQTAFAESRARITSELKALQKAGKSKTEAMQEGVKLVQQVSKSIVEKSQTVPSVVFPTKRRGYKGKTVYGRIGRVLLRDLRVFTRDHRFDKTQTSGPRKDDDPDDGADSAAPNRAGAWNKPIWLGKVTLRAAELCPPLSAKDKEGLPAVFQPLDRCFEIVWKRVLTEIAKSNTGAFFQTAVGEVLDFYMEAAKNSANPKEVIAVGGPSAAAAAAAPLDHC
jgi:hypothetical protein